MIEEDGGSACGILRLGIIWSVSWLVQHEGPVMTSVGSFEAKTHLPELLERVAKGEKILITRRGQPVAMLVPATAQDERNLRELVKEMLEFRDREGPTLGSRATVRELTDAGRRF
jgi:prevent-host-death family protein